MSPDHRDHHDPPDPHDPHDPSDLLDPDRDRSGREWTVTTWNVHGSQRPDLAAVAGALGVQRPDVVVLQEIRRGQAATLAAALSMRYSWAPKHYPYTRLAKWLAEGAAIMTPHALDAAGHTEISDGQRWSSWRRRIVQWALVGRSDGTAYRVYNLHLSPHDDAASRRAEAVRVATIVADHGDEPPAIVAGDFNDSDEGHVIYALPGIEHIVPPYTNPAELPTQLLDHVLLPAGAGDVSVTVPAGGPAWATLSDHLPVTVRFTQ